jgi:gamma-glutamyl-gamma-aminobutyrate hydrolase PuuD
MQPSSARPTPRIVLTVADPAAQAEPDIQRRKNALYADGIVRAGGEPVVLDASADPAARAAAFAAMEGLLLTGGADLDPARYGRPNEGSTGVEPDRDALEAEAWAAAAERDLPVLGLCRGMQAINVFMGGSLLQHLAGHAGAAYGHGPAMTHPVRLVPGTRLGRILAPTTTRAGTLEVNSYHHQAIRPTDLAPGLAPAAWASSAVGEIVEAVEATTGRFVVGVQCHPERTESTPPAFDRLWRFFVDACRGPAAAR